MKTDVAIVGGGPGGAACAIYLADLGISSAIIEKEQFPRYHIGESTTGEVGRCIRHLGLADECNARRFPIKHGVDFFGPDGNNRFHVPVVARDETGLHTSTTWQVRRNEFDEMLLRMALSRGASLCSGEALEPLRDGDAVTGVRVKMADGGVQDVEAEVVADASGLSTFLCQHGVTSPKERGNYDKQVAIYSQISGAGLDDGETRGNTLLYYREPHHRVWFIPIDDDCVSVGVCGSA